MNSTTRLKINRPNVIDEVIDGEVVAIDFETGSYYSLDEVGAVVWRLIDENANLSEILEKVPLEYEGNYKEIETSVLDLLDQLEREKLIRYSRTEVGERPPIDCHDIHADIHRTRRPFKAPNLIKHTDMQEMLLLDPIHDVDKSGWPNIQAPMK